MRRICIFCETWESGGIESFLHDLLLHIDLSGLEVDIVAARLGESIFTDRLAEKGVRFLCLSGSTRRLFANRAAFLALLRERRYDLIHCNLFQGLSLGYLWLAKREGVPVRIAHSHNTALRKSPTRPLKLALHHLGSALFSDAATDLWACSAAAAAFLFSKRALRERGFAFIPNGIDTARFRFDPAAREAVRAELGLTDAFVVGNVGRLCSQKNQTFLLDAFSALLKQRPESRLLLVGSGDQTELTAKAERLQIADKVIFYGVSQTVERLLWAMDIFAFPSLFEGLPVTLVEAQAAGLPIVCSDNITGEAQFTPLIRPLSLSAGAEGWARAMLEEPTVPPRQQTAAMVREAGFEISDVARRIERRYRGA